MADSQKYGRTAQLFNYNTSVIGGIGSNGEDVWSDSARRSDYIQVKGGSTYTLSGNGGNIRFFVYDENKNYLNDNFLYSAPFTISNNGYIRFAGGLTSVIDTIMLNEGSTALPYQPYIGWQHSLRKLTTATEAVENPLYADGTAITSYTIKGNTVQSGTPTRSNPVDVNGVGERTENLWDEDYTNISSDIYYKPVYVGDFEIVTVSSTIPLSSQNFASLFALGGQQSSGASTGDNGVYSGRSMSVHPVDGYITIAYRNANGVNPQDYDTMVNKGRTALPYEPYGYEIPISNGQTTTPMYLTEQLMKIGDTADSLVSDGTVSYNIRKYVLTGDENIEVLSSGQAPIRISGLYFRRPAYTDCTWLCTHYPCVPNSASWGSYDYCLTVSTQDSDSQMRIRDINYNSGTASDFKAYLAAQYAAGTPVTIWVVLSTRTEQVTAPSIPTADGANSITVDTTVQPSEFTATWTGWHDASVKEWDGSQWQ